MCTLIGRLESLIKAEDACSFIQLSTRVYVIPYLDRYKLLQSSRKRLMPMLLQRYKIYIAHREHPLNPLLQTTLLLLLLLLRIRPHFLAEGKVRHFQTSESSNTNKQDQKQRDDSSKAHEKARCEVLVPLEKAAFIAG